MIYNTSSGMELAKKMWRADSFLTRLRGLMFTKCFPPQYDALLLTPCNSVHTFCMRYTIDVIFLDSEMKVVHIYENMRPCRVSPVVRGAKQVLEVSEGTVKKTKTQVGDLLSLQ